MPLVPCPDLPPELARHPKYLILRELGRGGMGVVYQARQTVMNRQVVIKVINRSLLEQPGAVERFRREVQAAAQLSHPNIVAAYDAEQAGELHILVMEFVPGQSLAEVLEKKGPLSVANACYYVRQTAVGLQHAHDRGMVHRDIKPQNLMLTPKGRIKILDFGLAKLVSERGKSKGLTPSDACMGTPEYISPEQAQDASSADIRADLYSLGCTLYCLLAGRPPFREETWMKTILAHIQKAPPPLPELRPDVPDRLWRVVARLLAKDPAQRYQKPVEVVQALAPFAKPGTKPDAREDLAPTPGINSPERGTKIVANTNLVKQVLRELPGKMPAQAVPAKTEVDSPFADFAQMAVSPRKVERQSDASKYSSAAWWKRPRVVAVAMCTTLALILMTAGVSKVKELLVDRNSEGETSPTAGTGKSKEPSATETVVSTADQQQARTGTQVAERGPARGTIVLEIDPISAEVFVDEKKFPIANPGDNKQFGIELEPGRHHLRIWKDGFEEANREIELKAGMALPMKVTLPHEEGFTPLSGGKNWKKWYGQGPMDGAGKWDFGDTELHASYPQQRVDDGPVLATKRTDFQDFQLRFEVKLDGAEVIFSFRDQPPLLTGNKKNPIEKTMGYGVLLTDARREMAKFAGQPSGTLFAAAGINKNELLLAVSEDKWKEAEWNTVEVTAKGNELSIAVNGTKVAKYVDEEVRFRRGGLSFNPVPNCELFVRNIRIKEFPPTTIKPITRPSLLADDKEFIPLFNGKDFTGWKTFPEGTGGWKIEAGLLTGRGPQGHLFSVRSDYENFHLRAECRINKAGSSGLCFRVVFEPGVPRGYEALLLPIESMEGGTGSLLERAPAGKTTVHRKAAEKLLLPPNQWSTIEVIAKGEHIVIRVNGKTAVDHLLPRGYRKKGHLALAQLGAATVVEFRKIEIKELPIILADDATVDDLCQALKGKDPALREVAAARLSKLGPKAEPAIFALAEALNDAKSPARVRRNAAIAIAHIGPAAKPVARAVANALTSEPLEVRQFVAEALAAMKYPGNEAALPAILRALEKDSDPVVRQWCAWALAEVEPAEFRKRNADKTLLKLLEDKSSSTIIMRLTVARTLAYIMREQASDKTFDVLLEILSNKSITVTEYKGTEVKEKDDRRPEEGDSTKPQANLGGDGRYYAVMALGWLGKKAAKRPDVQEALRKAAKDKDVKLRETAQQVMKDLNIKP